MNEFDLNGCFIQMTSLIIFPNNMLTFIINFIFQKMSNLPSAILLEKYREWKNGFFRSWKRKYGNQYFSAFLTSLFFTFTIGTSMTYACYWIFLKNDPPKGLPTKEEADEKLRRKIETLKLQIEKQERR